MTCPIHIVYYDMFSLYGDYSLCIWRIFPVNDYQARLTRKIRDAGECGRWAYWWWGGGRRRRVLRHSVWVGYNIISFVSMVRRKGQGRRRIVWSVTGIFVWRRRGGEKVGWLVVIPAETVDNNDLVDIILYSLYYINVEIEDIVEWNQFSPS